MALKNRLRVTLSLVYSRSYRRKHVVFGRGRVTRDLACLLPSEK